MTQPLLPQVPVSPTLLPRRSLLVDLDPVDPQFLGYPRKASICLVHSTVERVKAICNN